MDDAAVTPARHKLDVRDYERMVNAYRQPEGREYAETATHRGGDRVALSAAPDIVVTVPAVLR